MGKFKDLVKEYTKNGSSQEIMWKSVDVIDELMCEIEEKHIDKFWSIMRKMNEIYEDGHYSEELAKMDVSEMQSEQHGETYEGEFWTMQQILDNVQGAKKHLADYYVALNYWKHKFGEKYRDRFGNNADEYIIEDAVDFFFCEDSEKSIWDYLNE